jgi:plastocyanin
VLSSVWGGTSEVLVRELYVFGLLIARLRPATLFPSVRQQEDSMSDTVTAPEAPAPDKGFSWRSLLRAAAIAGIVVTIVVLVLAGLIPPLIVFIVLWIVGLWLLRRPGKAGSILLLVVFLAYLALNAPFVLPQLMVPASSADFVIALASTLAGIAGVVAAIAVLAKRGDAPSGAARALGGVLVGLFVAGVALSIYQNAAYENAELAEGDVEITTVDIEFSPDAPEAEAGQVSVFVRNDDPILHTFTLDELDVDLEIPAGKSARITFEADAGEYSFYCRPHETDMEGTLTVR